MGVVVVRPDGLDADLECVLHYLNVPDLSIEYKEGIEAPVLVDGGIDGSASIAAHFASSESPRLLGETAAQQAEVNQWVNFGLYTLKPGIAGKVLRVVRDSARAINHTLEKRDYLAGESLSLADVFMYEHLYDYVLKLNDKQKAEVSHLSRWFDLVQHIPNLATKPIINMTPAPVPVVVPVTKAPKASKKAPAPKTDS